MDINTLTKAMAIVALNVTKNNVYFDELTTEEENDFFDELFYVIRYVLKKEVFEKYRLVER